MTVLANYVKREYQPSSCFDTFVVNGHLFALFYKTIKAEEKLNIHLQEYNIIILGPMMAKDDVTIKARNIFIFNTLTSKEGGIQFQLSEKIFIFLKEPLIAPKKYMSCVKRCIYLPVLDKRIDDIKTAFFEAIEETCPKIASFALNLIADIVDDPSCSSKELVSVEKMISLLDLQPKTTETEKATGTCAASN